MTHLQGKDGRDWFVITDGVFHVTSVVVLSHFGAAGQAWNGATLPRAHSCAGRCSGSQAPQDPVGPSWFTLLPTDDDEQRVMMKKGGRGSLLLVFLKKSEPPPFWVSGPEFRHHQPGVICVCSNVKLVGGREFQRPFMETLQHSFTVFGHIELQH